MSRLSEIEEAAILDGARLSLCRNETVLALCALIRQQHEALERIFDFTTGYDDVAGIACRMSRKALAAGKEWME